MMDVTHTGLSFCHESREHHRRPRTEIRCTHSGSTERVPTLDRRRAPIDTDLCPHALELINVHKSILKDGLCNNARPLCNGQHRHELRLHIRRKARVGQCLEVNCLERAIGIDTNPRNILLNLRARFF